MRSSCCHPSKLKSCLKLENFGDPIYSQLHHFSDACKDGYGTVSYIRLKNSRGEDRVTFLLGKARVTPLKAVTIPRLELTAAVLFARVDAMLKTELQIQLDESVFWTDSTSVLQYINSKDRRFHTFVANRISALLNRGTLAPRTIRPMLHCGVWTFLKIQNWLEGPSFLWKSEADWPICNHDVRVDSEDPEVKEEAYVNVTVHLISYVSC